MLLCTFDEHDSQPYELIKGDRSATLYWRHQDPNHDALLLRSLHASVCELCVGCDDWSGNRQYDEAAGGGTIRLGVAIRISINTARSSVPCVNLMCLAQHLGT